MEILFEDNHLIAVNKSVADIVQPDKTGDLSLEEKVKQYLREKYHKKGNVFLGVVHRIDRPVSGVVLFARTSKALERLNKMFHDRQVKKIYWAIVKNPPSRSEGTLIHYLKRDGKKNKSYVFDKPSGDAKQAVLHYKVLAEADRYYLLKIMIETGRHHQIRCQLASMGCPIRGDLKYGFPRSNPDGGISLHARKIELTHPVGGEPLVIVAPPPSEKLWNYFVQKAPDGE